MSTETFLQYVNNLPSASTPLAGAELAYVIQGGLSKKAPISAISPAPAAASVNWINVKNAPYNATGNGSTDDTTAINAAIVAFNTAGAGVLYFPAGTYLVSSGLTTITAVGQVTGDGTTVAENGNSGAATTITSASATILLFQSNSFMLSFRDINIVCTAATPSASIAITQLSSVGGNHVLNLYDVTVRGWWTGVDWQEANQTQVERVIFGDCVQYGCRVRNLTTPDAGGNRFLDCEWGNTVRAGVAGLRWESSGNTALIGCTVYGGSSPNILTTGVDAHGAGTTSIFLVQGCSFENYLTNALSILNTNLVCINNLEIGCYQQSGSQAPIQINTCQNVVISNVVGTKPSAPNCSLIDFNSGSCSNVLVSTSVGGGHVSGIVGLNTLQNITGALLEITGFTDVATIRAFTASPIGCRYMVNNTSQASPTLGQLVVAGDAGGTNIQPVFSDGAGNWRYG